MAPRSEAIAQESSLATVDTDRPTKRITIEPSRWESFVDAWHALNRAKLATFTERAGEYGALDLTLMGDTLERVMFQRAPGSAGSEALACLFYLHGKMSRVISAWQAGHAPSHDTLLDLAAYADMLVLAEEGRWPR